MVNKKECVNLASGGYCCINSICGVGRDKCHTISHCGYNFGRERCHVKEESDNCIIFESKLIDVELEHLK